MMVGKKRRFWSEEEKRLICEQTRVPGVSVAQVARRYSMNANMVFKWLRDARFSPDASGTEAGDVFLPVEVSELDIAASPSTIDLSPAVPAVPDPPVCSSGVLAQRFEITLSDGRRILIEGPTELDAVIGLVKGLMS